MKLKDIRIKERVIALIEKMQAVNYISELNGVKKLSGSANAYRLRISDYRLGFTMNENAIVLTILAHRKDIYNKFP